MAARASGTRRVAAGTAGLRAAGRAILPETAAIRRPFWEEAVAAADEPRPGRGGRFATRALALGVVANVPPLLDPLHRLPGRGRGGHRGRLTFAPGGQRREEQPGHALTHSLHRYLLPRI